jgi:hypothetical protein
MKLERSTKELAGKLDETNALLREMLGEMKALRDEMTLHGKGLPEARPIAEESMDDAAIRRWINSMEIRLN